jgi:hypothetical protein
MDIAERKAELRREFPEWSILTTEPSGRWRATRGPKRGEFAQPGESCRVVRDFWGAPHRSPEGRSEAGEEVTASAGPGHWVRETTVISRDLWTVTIRALADPQARPHDHLVRVWQCDAPLAGAPSHISRHWLHPP